MALLLYGSGLRLLECLRLRVKDIDFEKRCLTVRDGKGGKDRVTVLPDSVIEPLLRQIEHVRAVHGRDLAGGLGAVYLPHALDRRLEDGYDIRTIQELLGHSDVSKTMIYTHVMNRGGRGVRSPADRR